jgi:hypothetical protein
MYCLASYGCGSGLMFCFCYSLDLLEDFEDDVEVRRPLHPSLSRGPHRFLFFESAGTLLREWTTRLI